MVSDRGRVEMGVQMVLTSSIKGYPRSIRALLETNLDGIRVFPFFGYALCTVVALLRLEDLLLTLDDLEVLV